MKVKQYLESKKNNVRPMAETLNAMGRELAADIVKEVKELKPDQVELKRQLNKERIKALGFKLIQGGKSDKE